MLATYDEDVYGASSSRFLAQNGKAASRSQPAINGRRSSASLRGSSIAKTLDDDSATGRHSLAHELAVALMPEPSAGSKLLAEEFGIEYDEGAEGIDQSSLASNDEVAEPNRVVADTFGMQQVLPEPSSGVDAPTDFDPAFDTPTTPQIRTKVPDQDPMITLAQDLESTDRFLSHLRRLDADQPNIERFASDIIRRIDDTVRERESQVRELLEYEREFRRIAGEIGGNDALGRLEELEDLIDSPRPEVATRERSRTLSGITEEQSMPALAAAAAADWDAEIDRDRERVADDDEDYELYSPSPLKTTFSVPPLPAGPPTPTTAIVQLTHFRTFTASVASSLATISEQTQVNSAATTEAGRKVRALKNKLGGWRSEWESAERSREKIEKWEAGVVEVTESTLVVVPGQPAQAQQTRPRIDGRKVVEEHLEAFKLALKEANVKTEAIMAAVR